MRHCGVTYYSPPIPIWMAGFSFFLLFLFLFVFVFVIFVFIISILAAFSCIISVDSV